MNEKKVIAVIVEGPSDENAIGGILKEFFSSEEVQFAVVHGDITSNEFTTVDNVIRKIDGLLDGIKSKYGYHWDDFIKVIHIADTDGVFAKDCVVEADVEEIQYYEDHMEGAVVEAIERRNKHKSEILYGVLKNFSDDEKEEMSDDFAERYEGKVNDFISFISDEAVAVPGTYKETWRFIEKDKHSLERHSNMNLIFEK